MVVRLFFDQPFEANSNLVAVGAVYGSSSGTAVLYDQSLGSRQANCPIWA